MGLADLLTSLTSCNHSSMCFCVCLPILAAEEVLGEILAYPKLLGPTLGRGRRETHGIEPSLSFAHLCAFVAQVVTLSFQECQTSQISYDFLNIKLSITDFPDLTIFVDTHSSRVAESGCCEKMMRNAAAGIDKHRKEAWQAPKCV